jgi:hypothetical protein
MEMSAGVAAAASGLKRRWIKYYCEECEAWETREMFEVVKFEASASASSPSASASTVWSWGCAKLIRHGTFQSFRVEQLNNADGHDVVAPKLDFPASPTPVPAVHEPPPPPSPQLQPPPPAEDEVLPANSNGSSRPKRNVRSTYARESPLNSQGGVTSSSPDEVLPHENGTSKDVAPESPAVIDAEQHENGAQKRPRRLTAGDRGLAQALQFERPRKVATPSTPKVAADVKPSPPSLAAAMKRPKRVTAGLKGIAIAAENAKSGTPRQPSVKKEPRKDQVHQVSVQTRSASASKPSKKNKKVGDLY